jgi:hypothetical protein
MEKADPPALKADLLHRVLVNETVIRARAERAALYVRPVLSMPESRV